MQRLAGLVKHVLSQQDGWANLPRLAAATAQKEWVVQGGLEWLAARGYITVLATDEKAKMDRSVFTDDDRIRIAPGSGSDALQAALLLDQIQTSLEETHAYRAYFSRSDIQSLLT